MYKLPYNRSMNKLQPYLQLMRLDKPIGIFLTLWPTLWAVWIAGLFHPTVKIMVIFVFGAVVMRAAGCVINDVADRKFDPHVARTKLRPLASGAVKLWQALALFVGLLFIALVLVLQLNLFAFWVACVTVPLTIVYPFCKRFTYLPQVILGMVFNIGILMAFAAQQNHLLFIAWLLYFSTIIWTVAYDTMYAITDQEDDKKLGLKSTALLFGSHALKITGLLQLLFLLGILWLGLILKANIAYWIAYLIAIALCVYQQNLLKHGQSFKAFLNNNWLGMIMFIGILFLN